MDITQEKLERLNALGTQLTQWEQGFTESVAAQYKRRNLSDGQHAVIDKILAKHNPDAIKARDEWRANYDDEKREIARKVAEYYKKNPPYYGDVADKILNDPAYIPSEKCFRKMTGNKYAQRALAAAATPPVFAKGQLVRFRRNDDVRRNYGTKYKGTLGVVLSVGTDKQVSALKGSRPYGILPMGSTKTLNVCEKFLMRSKTA